MSMVIIRHSEPSKLDQATKGTVCEVIHDHMIVATYIQNSEDEENPKWELLATFIPTK